MGKKSIVWAALLLLLTVIRWPREQLLAEDALASLSATTSEQRKASVLSMTPPPPLLPRNLTLLVELRGELSNQLSILAGAYVTKLQIEHRLSHVYVHIVGQHQNHSKWVRGASDLKACFPTFRELSLEGGIWDMASNFNHVRRQQAGWLGDSEKKLVNVIHDKDIDYLLGLLLDQQHEVLSHRVNTTSNIPLPVNGTTATNTHQYRYSLPYLKSNAFYTFAILNNSSRYRAIRELFAWNETACCQLKADPDERVYHFRNFLTELGQHRSFDENFIELSPQRTAQHLFGPVMTSDTDNDRPKGHGAASSSQDRIRIVSRYPENLGPFSDALRAVGYNVTLSSPQRGVEDLCLLMSTRRELVGSIRSTFTRWAAILGNATSNRLFTVRRKPDNGIDAANWTPGSVQRLDDGRVFYWDTYYQPESYSLDEASGRQGKARERKQWAEFQGIDSIRRK